MNLEQLKEKYKNVPIELKQLKRWVCYKIETEIDSGKVKARSGKDGVFAVFLCGSVGGARGAVRVHRQKAGSRGLHACGFFRLSCGVVRAAVVCRTARIRRRFGHRVPCDTAGVPRSDGVGMVPRQKGGCPKGQKGAAA